VSISTSNEAEFKPPRKKVNILWWIGGAFFLLVLLFFLQLLGPNPRIVVSRETTFVTEPLGTNGLPDYERYVMETGREGVTPANNSAVLLWQALWPGELSPQHYAPMAAELGLLQIPSTAEALVVPSRKAFREKLNNWLIEQPGSEGVGAPEELWVIAYDRSMKRPWKGDQIPPMAQWVAENEKPLDTIVEASKRSRYFSPSPSHLDDKRELLITTLLPGAHGIRDAARALSIRAMWHLGEGRAMEAWADIHAMHRLSRLLTQSCTLVEQLVAMAIGDMACTATQTLLHHGNLTPEQVKKIQVDLAALPAFAGVVDAIDQGERLFAIDAFVEVGTGHDEELAASMNTPNESIGGGALQMVSVDWNLVLRETNAWYDRLVAAARLPDRAERAAALRKLETDIDRMVSDSWSTANVAAAVVSQRQRSEFVSARMLGLFFPAVSTATNREDLQNLVMELTRLAAALAQFRAENGAYPEKLEELVPGMLQSLPNDPNSSMPLLYKRDGGGFLLYSVGANGKDDGGSFESMNVVEGHSLDDLDEKEADRLAPDLPTGSDDPSIRVPRPMFELPTTQGSGEP
jgi:hypothetical protein